MRRRETHVILEIALLITVGLLLFVFESLLPRPLPWFKPGLANLVTVVALYRYSIRAALWVTLCRILLGSLIVGAFFTPSFTLAVSAGLTSTLVMGWAKNNRLFRFSPIGVSLCGSVAHNLTQLVMAWFIIVHHLQLFRLLPLMLFPALVTGPLVGLVAVMIMQKFHEAYEIRTVKSGTFDN